MVCFRGCHIANHHAVVLWSCVLYFTTSPKWNLHCRVRDAATQRLQIRTNSASRKFASWCCGTLKVLDRQLRKRRWFAQNGNGGPNVGVHQCNKMCFFGLSWNHNRHRRHIHLGQLWLLFVFGTNVSGLLLCSQVVLVLCLHQIHVIHPIINLPFEDGFYHPW